MVRRPRITPISDYKDYVVIENITVLHQSPNPQERGEKTYLKDATLSGQLVTIQFSPNDQPKERVMIGNINDGYSLLPTDALKEKKAETAIEEVLALKSDEPFLKLSRNQTILAAVAILGLIVLIK